jgi:hypothetical protein
MPRSNRRLAVLTSVLVVALALAGPPAQAREAGGLIDNLSAQVTSWMAAWWPWSASPKGMTNIGHVKTSHAADALRVRAVVGGRAAGAVERPGGGPAKTAVCINPAADPNGCPP